MTWLYLMPLLAALAWFLLYKHIRKALQMARRSGRFGPAINEKNSFANRVIKSTNPQPWQMDSKIAQSSLSEHTQNQLTSLGSAAFLVIRDHTICYEQYWAPYDQDQVINSFSVAKSVVNILIGIALRKDMLALDDTVSRYLKAFDRDDRRQLTVKHLLMMSSGLKWIESEINPWSHNARGYYGEDLEGLVYRMKVKGPPGKQFEYLSGNTQILAMTLAAATGKTISDFAQDELWGPIGSENDAYWNLDRKNGMEKAFCCLYATPRDFARIGKLYLQAGSWDGRELVPSWFVKESLHPSGLFDVWRKCTNDIYGWHWWITQHRGYDFFYARGIRGQYIICNLDLDLIIVRMGQNRNPVDRHTGHPPDLFDHIDAGLEIIGS